MNNPSYDYAYDRGSAIPLQADEACNAIVDYINEQLQNIESEVAKNDNRKFEANSN